MPDPSGENTPPLHEKPGSSRPTASAKGPSPLAPAPRVHLPTIHHPPAAPKVPPPPPGYRAVLEWLRQYGNLDLDPDETNERDRAGSPAFTSRPTREQRKFHRFDPDHPQATPPGESNLSRVDGTTNAEGDSPGDDQPRGITAEQIAYIRQLRAGASERRLWIALSVAVVGFLLVAAAFLASHTALSKMFAHSPEPAVPPQKSPNTFDARSVLSAGSIGLLDQAMAAEAASDYVKAIELLERAQRDAGHIYGLSYRLAALCYKANEMPQVLPLLNQSIADGEEVAASYSLRGTLSDQIEGTPQDPCDLEKATRLEPLNARYFFVWGEALRHAGKPQLALRQLQRAVERAQEPALAAIYALKLRLTQIELGQADAFAGELADKLKDAPPPVDWLLTAAADEMHRGDFPAAAVMLGRIRGLVGVRETARQLDDVFFKSFAGEAELAPFFEVATQP